MHWLPLNFPLLVINGVKIPFEWPKINWNLVVFITPIRGDIGPYWGPFCYTIWKEKVYIVSPSNYPKIYDLGGGNSNSF